MMMWNFHITQVSDTIHLELAEEQWEITQGSNRRVERTGFLAQYLVRATTLRCSSYMDLAMAPR